MADPTIANEAELKRILPRLKHAINRHGRGRRSGDPGLCNKVLVRLSARRAVPQDQIDGIVKLMPPDDRVDIRQKLMRVSKAFEAKALASVR